MVPMYAYKVAFFGKTHNIEGWLLKTRFNGSHMKPGKS